MANDGQDPDNENAQESREPDAPLREDEVARLTEFVEILDRWDRGSSTAKLEDAA